MKSISVDDLAALGSAVTVIDVREEDEHAQAHVPGVVSVPLSRLAGSVAGVPRADPIYVMCASGGRSVKATGLLLEQGFDAVNVLGGITEWYRNGHPVIYAVRA